MAEIRIFNTFIELFMAPGHHIPIEWLETFRIDDPEFGILLYMERRDRIIRKSECIRGPGRSMDAVGSSGSYCLTE